MTATKTKTSKTERAAQAALDKKQGVTREADGRMSDDSRGVWKWLEIEPGKRWETPLIPAGDYCVARVERSLGKNREGAYGYYAYRSGQLLAMCQTPEKAQMRARKGGERERDNVLVYVSEYSPDIPPFLLLTEKEQRDVRSTYPWAAPSEAKVRAFHSSHGRGEHRPGPDARDLSDPSTRAYLEQMARPERHGGTEQEGSPVRPGGRGMSTRGGAAAVRRHPEARLALVGAPDNPGRPGTRRHAGYKLILDAAAEKVTVAECLKRGADERRLGKCVAKGLVELIETEKKGKKR